MLYAIRWLFHKEPLVQPTEGISQEISNLLAIVESVALRHWILVNDYFAWPTEKNNKRESRLNAIDFIMDTYKLPEEAALTFMKGMVAEQEVMMKSCLGDIKAIVLAEDPSADAEDSFAVQYAESMMHLGSGNMVWHLSTQISKPNQIDKPSDSVYVGTLGAFAFLSI
jgi:hypothetical protein